jgi:nucleoside-diphosphate-sugar epimerase
VCVKALVTGGAGFIGSRLALFLLGRPELERLVLLDVVQAQGFDDPRVESVAGDIADVADLVDSDGMSVFHLASVVSAGAELDFDLALRVNVDGMRTLLEALRRRRGTRLVFTSTMAVYGGSAMPAVVGDTTKQTPQTTYGMTKAVCELLVNDYTRKGFLDGRSARLPTVIVRPGAPNLAASSYASAIFREPLAGTDYTCPVGLDTRVPVIGHRTVVGGIARLHDVESERIGDDRAVMLPSIAVSVREMIESLRRVAGDRRLGEIDVRPDPAVEAIVHTWARDATSERALALGLPADPDLDSIVRAYVEDFVGNG